tara:strand:+ start:1318 stop:2226 length:909 start_codon:yes stop_codon:yes gene_type:complete
MLAEFDNEIQKIRDIRDKKIVEGIKLGVPEIDEYIRLKKGNFNVILGHANVGKTTIVLYLMLLYSIKHNCRWLIFSSENDPYTLIKKIIEFLEHKPINKIENTAFESRLNWINDHFKFVSNDEIYDWESLRDLAQAVKDVWSYDGFMIDPYNSLTKKLTKGLNSHEYDYNVTTEMRMFCKKNRITLWLCAHAATEALRKKHSTAHEYYDLPIPPMASDIEGGGKFVNRADDFLVIHRYVQHPTDWMYTHLHIRKVKDIDTGGRPTPIDNPIKLKSIVNNVGFEINNVNLIEPPDREQKKLPI